MPFEATYADEALFISNNKRRTEHKSCINLDTYLSEQPFMQCFFAFAW